MGSMKGPQPTVTTGPSKNEPVKMPEVGDMEHFHKMATSGALTDLLFKLGGTRKNK
jgi:hypothetical protein